MTFTIGQQVTWIYIPPGGYGYTLPVNGVVTKIGKARIQIQVTKRDGSPALRWVKPDNLTPKGQRHEIHT